MVFLTIALVVLDSNGIEEVVSLLRKGWRMGGGGGLKTSRSVGNVAFTIKLPQTF